MKQGAKLLFISTVVTRGCTPARWVGIQGMSRNTWILFSATESWKRPSPAERAQGPRRSHLTPCTGPAAAAFRPGVQTAALLRRLLPRDNGAARRGACRAGRSGEGRRALGQEERPGPKPTDTAARERGTDSFAQWRPPIDGWCRPPANGSPLGLVLVARNCRGR